MLKMTNQIELNFSKHIELYDILIPENNFWKQLNDMIDFSFVVDMLKDKYSSTMGRTAEDVIRMFKFLLLKSYFKLSDRGLIERTMKDMLFKYFLGYDSEETKLIEKSNNNGIEVEAIIGDGAYSEKDNLDYCKENNIKNISKLSKSVTHGNGKNKDDFEYNKDEGMYICKVGHMV